MPTLDFQ